MSILNQDEIDKAINKCNQKIPIVGSSTAGVVFPPKETFELFGYKFFHKDYKEYYVHCDNKHGFHQLAGGPYDDCLRSEGTAIFKVNKMFDNKYDGGSNQKFGNDYIIDFKHFDPQNNTGQIIEVSSKFYKSPKEIIDKMLDTEIGAKITFPGSNTITIIGEQKKSFTEYDFAIDNLP